MNVGDTVAFESVDSVTGDVYDLTLRRLSVGGVALTYTRLADYVHSDSYGHLAEGYTFAFGIPTGSADMPKTGSASYSTNYFATVSDPLGAGLYIADNSTGAAVFSADFGMGTVSTAIDLSNLALPNHTSTHNFGVLNGVGRIDSNGSGFAGNWTDPAVNGGFAGAFFGPKAAEMGMGFDASGVIQVTGWMAAKKK